MSPFCPEFGPEPARIHPNAAFDAINSPVLTQIILPREQLAAALARERDLLALVRALVYHQIVRLGEAPLAELAGELALWSHLTTKVRPTIIVINSHHRKHCAYFFILCMCVGVFICVMRVFGVCVGVFMLVSRWNRFFRVLCRSSVGRLMIVFARCVEASGMGETEWGCRSRCGLAWCDGNGSDTSDTANTRDMRTITADRDTRSTGDDYDNGADNGLLMALMTTMMMMATRTRDNYGVWFYEMS